MNSSTGAWRLGASHVASESVIRAHAEKVKRRVVYRKLCTVYMKKNAYFLISAIRQPQRTKLGRYLKPLYNVAPLWCATSLPRQIDHQNQPAQTV